MKRILILCPLTQTAEQWERTNQVRAEYFDAGCTVTDLQEVVERWEDKPGQDKLWGPLGAAIAHIFDNTDEVLLMPNWRDSRECMVLERICAIYGISVRSVLQGQTNFTIRKYGDKCPMQYMVADEPARVSMTQCQPCQYCIRPVPSKKTVLCKVVQDQ